MSLAVAVKLIIFCVDPVLLFLLPFMALFSYFWLVVRSFYMDIKESKKNVLSIYEQVCKNEKNGEYSKF